MSMKVELISYTHGADRLCNDISHTCTMDCTSDFLQSLPETKMILPNVISSGHLSVVEHAVYTFSISGVSRALTHQLVRHRMASYTQQSQRYVDTCPNYVTPPSMEGNKDYENAMDTVWHAYELLCTAVPTEDARYVLPNSACTNITVTMNARELLHFFALRCCERAQWEIRDMAYLMLKKCKGVAPIIFKKAGPPCVHGKCPEGKRTCGHPKDKVYIDEYLKEI